MLFFGYTQNTNTTNSLNADNGLPELRVCISRPPWGRHQAPWFSFLFFVLRLIHIIFSNDISNPSKFFYELRISLSTTQPLRCLIRSIVSFRIRRPARVLYLYQSAWNFLRSMSCPDSSLNLFIAAFGSFAGTIVLVLMIYFIQAKRKSPNEQEWETARQQRPASPLRLPTPPAELPHLFQTYTGPPRATSIFTEHL
ncbi:hypothetical protein HD806DRAFT_213953 [Xylariaceae sp. AK1471]|nr:hypothetical protein HD806DRAFT_213953 [Xylariaceae sp. AK1471]